MISRTRREPLQQPSTLPRVRRSLEHDPVWLVECAWSVFRLPRLQELIRVTIEELHALPRASSAEERAHGDPVSEALQACCDGLRDAAGIHGAALARAEHCQRVRAYMAERPVAWAKAFESALRNYDKAASLALEQVLGKPARSADPA